MSVVATSAAEEEADYFASFGIERRYAIDRETLDRRYFELSRDAHPDRVAGSTTREMRLAVERSSRINVAYRILRDPVKRAEYLVKLGGIDLDRTGGEGGAPDPGQAFLVEMVELRESLEEASSSGPAALDRLRASIESRSEDSLDAGIDAIEDDDIRGAAMHLVIHRYLQRFLDEVDAEAGPDD